MFGYIRINKNKLKIKEYNHYRAFYCSLCRCLNKNYGVGAKLLLNYDCTFFALLLCLAGREKPKFEKGRCAVNPLNRIMLAAPCREIEFAAALNVILAYYSLCDKKEDENSILGAAGAAVFKAAFKKAKKNYPMLANGVEQALCLLHETEKNKVADLDSAANYSAAILENAVAAFSFESESNKRLVGVLCRNIGRWIYLADAWCDREKDKKHESYNPFNLVETHKERAENLLYLSLATAHDAFDLIDKNDCVNTTAVLQNVLESGCSSVTAQVLAGTFLSKRRKKDSIKEES